jgi:hypothetical protein
MLRTSERYSNAAVGGIAAALLLCVWGVLGQYKLESAYQQQNRDPYLVLEQAARFAALAQALPQGAELGYLTDTQPDSVEATSMLLGAQYALAPRLLSKDGVHEWVLGNFTRPADFAALGQRNGLQMQQDFGNGVILFRRRH